MKRKIRLLCAFLAIAALAGGGFLFKKVTVLEIKNIDRPKAIHVRIGPAERFFISYVHSIYRESVIEEIQVQGAAVVLKGVRTKSPAVMEYYGFEDTAEFHPMNRSLGTSFLIKKGMNEGQALLIRDRRIDLSEIGQKGDRIQIRVQSLPLGKYIIGMME